VPAETRHAVWAIGNVRSCDANGFVMVLGSVAVPMYTLTLCVYYLYAVKFNMSNREFNKRIERKVHVGIITWCVVSCIVLLSTKNLNPVPGGQICYPTASPMFCDFGPSGQCVRGQNSQLYALIIIYIPLFICLLGVMISMIWLSYHVVSQERRNSRHLFRSLTNSRLSTTHRSSANEIHVPNSNQLAWLRQYIQRLAYSGRAVETRGERRSRIRQRETMIQASLYVGAFILVYVPLLSEVLIYSVGATAHESLRVIIVAFYPMGGFFNVLIYARPKVNTVRKRHSEYSWFRSFWEVVKAGGEVPDEFLSRRSCRRGDIPVSNAVTVTTRQQQTRGVVSARCSGCLQMIKKMMMRTKIDSSTADESLDRNSVGEGSYLVPGEPMNRQTSSQVEQASINPDEESTGELRSVHSSDKVDCLPSPRVVGEAAEAITTKSSLPGLISQESDIENLRQAMRSQIAQTKDGSEE